MRADLHFHSTASDGRLSPTEITGRVAARGVSLVSLTDHDTLAGQDEARQSAERLGIDWLAGVELSVSAAGEAVHLLAYGFDPEFEPFVGYVESFRADRAMRAEETISRLERIGIRIDREELDLEVADAVVTRPHMANAVVRAGGARSPAEAFERFLGDGKPCHVPMPARDAAEAVSLVRAAGGITSLAHPGDWTAHRTVLALVAAGLDALEAWHPSHDERLTQYYLAIAEQHGLTVTGGSDDHGTNDESTAACAISEPHLGLLRERLRLARRRSGRTD